MPVHAKLTPRQRVRRIKGRTGNLASKMFGGSTIAAIAVRTGKKGSLGRKQLAGKLRRLRAKP